MSNLSPSEKKGILVLSGVLLISFIFQALQPHHIQGSLYDYSVQDSIFKILSSDSLAFLAQNEIPAETVQKKIKLKESPAIRSININTASETELEKLPGIGPVTAGNIVEFRKTNGGFKSIEDIMKVKRIGPKTFEQIQPYIFCK
jgi:competence protein ComEA